ncbi:14340_t:CDS:2 [Acaulospora colombiana]|uniref:14340_t:CDS:1 n=1 Tax=Acaulospora colombiana TaxID=27376 RepID=A0ACA9JVJ4_9GLOM|nr:14340_t:CDS:2 [Acaulospora colombiana]
MPSETICFWSLLSIKDLSFIYISSWLSKALGPEQSLLLGTSFFDYVHPQDQDSAKRDLSDFVKKKTLTCSVTRKFQASAIAINSPKPFQPSNYPPQSITGDEYIIVDVGMSVELNRLSALLHKHSSTEFHKVQTPPATPHLDNQTLHERSNDEPGRIFQILDRHSRNLIFTWPNPSVSRKFLEAANYNQDDFSGLLRDVALTSDSKNSGMENVDSQPNCLRPVTDKRILLLTSGKYRQVESVVIPYGNIIFACFQILPSSSSVVSISLGGSAVFKPKAKSAPCSPASNAGIPKRPRSPCSLSPLPKLFHPDASNHLALPHYPSEVSEFNGDAYPSNKRQRHHVPEPAVSNDPTSMRISSPPRELPTCREYPQYQFQPISQPPQPKEQNFPSLSQHHAYYAPHGQQQPSQPPPHFIPSYPPGNNNHSSPHNPIPLLPPPPPQQSPSQTDPIQSQMFSQFAPQQRRSPSAVHGKKCESCHTSSSPEWRRGPTGHKTLCNACGLRYSRTIARENRKREQAQREQEQRYREQREREERAREKAEAMMMQRTIEPFNQYRPSNNMITGAIPPPHPHHHHRSPLLHPNPYHPTNLPISHQPPHHPHHLDSPPPPSMYATSPMSIKMEHSHQMHPSSSAGERGFPVHGSSQPIYYDRLNVGSSGFQGGNRGDSIGESNGHPAMNMLNTPPPYPKAYFGRAQ